MIENGFDKPRFFVRADELSPKPVSKLHERLYKEKDKKNKIIENIKKEMENEEFKECTFAPQVNKKFRKKYARSPRPNLN